MSGIIGLDEKYINYIFRRTVSRDIPDDLLVELKKINDDIKNETGEDYFIFPR